MRRMRMHALALILTRSELARSIQNHERWVYTYTFPFGMPNAISCSTSDRNDVFDGGRELMMRVCSTLLK